MGKLEKQQKWSVNGVIVTVHQESSTAEPRPRPRPRPRPQKIIRSTAPKSCGYDRRAELLAYAHHLRNVGSQHDHSPTDFSNLPNKPKKRRRWFARLKALKFSFGRLFGRDKNKAWKYENVESRDRENKYRTPPYPRRDRVRGRCNKISKKFGLVLQQFACVNKCSKGFDRNEDQYQDLHKTS